MLSAALLVLGWYAILQNGECAVTWTTPSGGTGTLATAVPEQQVTPVTALTGLTVTAVSITPLTIASYAILTNSNGLFTITGTLVGQLNLDANKGLDYETQASHVLVIEATDSTTGTALVGTATVTITVTDVTTDPIFSALSFCAVAADLAAAGTTIATIAATDPQATTPTYTIAPTSEFSVSAAGVVTVKAAVTLNRGDAGTYTVAIYAADDTQTGTATLTVCVGSTSQCASCSTSSTCNGAAAVTFSMLTLFIALLVLLR